MNLTWMLKLNVYGSYRWESAEVKEHFNHICQLAYKFEGVEPGKI